MTAFARIAFFATLLVTTMLALTTEARAGEDATNAFTSARVSLWDDTDNDDIVGSAGDTLRARVFSTDGTFALNATGCDACAVVIDRTVGDSVTAPKIAVSVDGVAMSSMAGLLWTDVNADGALGNGSDVLAGFATSVNTSLESPAPVCSLCGLVVVEWGGSGQDIDWVGSGQDIDSVTGNVINWGGSGQDIDWGGSGDDIDWGGSGDDIDWGGSGDDIDWGGSGDDIDGAAQGR